MICWRICGLSCTLAYPEPAHHLSHPQPWIVRIEQVSTHCDHNKVRLARPNDVDAGIVGWLCEVYQMEAP